MKCPFCGNSNIAGEAECEKCGEDLTVYDAARPQDRLEKSLVKDSIESLECVASSQVSPQSSVKEVAQQLSDTNRPVLVMEGEKLVGIVTERDLLFKFMGRHKNMDRTPISEIMTPNPTTLEPGDKIAVALNKMAIGGFRHLPILKNGVPQGVLSVRDILAYLAERFPKVVRPAH